MRTRIPLAAALVLCLVAPATRLFATPLPPSQTQDAVESLAAAVDREYFSPVVADRVATSLRTSLASGAYAAASTPRELADLLTRDMYALTHDKHLAVAVVGGAGGLPGDDRATRGRRENWGIRRAEILPGNIGYLDITGFYHPDEVGAALAAAMQRLEGADALIVDLRDNLGGSPDTAALIASYLFDRPSLPLFEIVSRSGESQRYTTDRVALPGSDGRRPLFVLTSARTFSAGEGLAFLLQERKRAAIIGETTAGAANPGRQYPITAVLSVMIPNGQVRSAVGGGNWEGVGVVPDIPAPEVDALKVAQERALRGSIARKIAVAPAWRALEGFPVSIKP